MKFAMILIFAAFILTLASPVYALSDLAERFLRDATRTDVIFPPDDWSNKDLRDAALEVLDAYENGDGEDWTVYFCIVTLCHTQNEEDLHRVLAYEDKMTATVLRALRGWSAPEAIECFFRWLQSDGANFRELAIMGIGKIDFNQLDDPDEWREKAMEELIDARANEPFEPYLELIDEVVSKIKLSVK